MPNYKTPEPISVTLELGVGEVRIAASDRTDTVVNVRPSDEADESDVKAAQQVRVDYTNGMLRDRRGAWPYFLRRHYHPALLIHF